MDVPGLLHRARRALPGRVRRLATRARGGGRHPAAAEAVEPWAYAAPHPWEPLAPPAGGGVQCNICRWEGDGFGGVAHSESALCPRCGSIARDRFLFWCLQRRATPPVGPGARLLETSPRLGASYRWAMSRWFSYLCSDYDERAHAGMIRLDLQAVDLPDKSLDAILTPHVLEHVPDTHRALTELARVLAPGGQLYLQIPLLQEATAPPTQPEFHGDDTPVFWRFGFDLTARLAAHGLPARLCCTRAWHDAVRSGASDWAEPPSPEFDVVGMLAGARAHVDDLVVVADHAEAARHGFEPGYMFLTWHGVRA